MVAIGRALMALRASILADEMSQGLAPVIVAGSLPSPRWR